MNTQIIEIEKQPPQAAAAVVKLYNNDLINLYLADVDRTQQTLHTYKLYLDKFNRFLQQQGIKQPTKQDIKNYKQFLLDTCSTATAADYLRVVKSFFKWADNCGYYTNIAANVNAITVKQDKHNKDALTDKAVKDIYNSIDSSTEQGKRLKAMYLLAITAGLRCIEIHRANKGDIEKQGSKAYLYIQGKGHTEKDTKILISDLAYKALKDYFNSQSIKTTAASPLFTATGNRNGGGRIAVTTISTMLKKAIQAAGYDSKRLTAHSLRHTSGTAAYKITNNLLEALKHCRHSKTETTEIYVHALEREDRNTEQKISDYYFKAEQQDTKTEILQKIETLTAEQLEKLKTMINFI